MKNALLLVVILLSLSCTKSKTAEPAAPEPTFIQSHISDISKISKWEGWQFHYCTSCSPTYDSTAFGLTSTFSISIIDTSHISVPNTSFYTPTVLALSYYNITNGTIVFTCEESATSSYSSTLVFYTANDSISYHFSFFTGISNYTETEIHSVR